MTLRLRRRRADNVGAARLEPLPPTRRCRPPASPTPPRSGIAVLFAPKLRRAFLLERTNALGVVQAVVDDPSQPLDALVALR